MINMKLLFTLLFISSLSYGQDTLFAKIFHKMPNNIDLTTNTSCKADSGNYFIAGQVNYGQQAFLQKVDSVGNEIWIRKYKKPITQLENFRFYEITQTSDSNLLLGGRILNDLQGMNNPIILKLDTNGDTLWTRSFSAVGNSGCARSFVLEGGQDEYYLIWSEFGIDALFVAKYDLNGSVTWQHKYPTINHYQVGGAAFDTVSNQLYITGLDYATSNTGAVFCIDQTGTYQWGKIHSDIHYWNSLIIDGIMYTSWRVPGNPGIGIASFDLNGGLNWLKSFNISTWGFYVDEPVGLEQNGDSTLVIFEKSDPAMWSVVCNVGTSGIPISSAEVWMMMTGAHFTDDGGFMLIGNGPMYGIKSNSTPHYGVVKTDSLFNSVDCLWPSSCSEVSQPTPGIASWNTTINGSGILGSNKVFYDTISTFSESGCVRFLGSLDENTDEFVSISPNPAADELNLNFTDVGIYQVILRDESGRIIVDQTINGGSGRVDLTTLSEGIYFCTVYKNSTLIQTEKVLVFK